MNIKEQKTYLRFLGNIANILDEPENRIQCEMKGEQIIFYVYDSNQLKKVKYEITLSKGNLNLLRVVTQKLVKDTTRPWNTSQYVERNVFRYSPQNGAELYDPEDNLYELNKISHFNLSLNNDMVLPYQQYRELYLEFKKLKSSVLLKITRKL